MKNIELETWEEFEAEVEKLNSFLSAQNEPELDKPLFRGQSKASWDLETSLERYLKKGVVVSIELYHSYLLKIKPAVEAYTGGSWKVDRCIKIEDTTLLTGAVPAYGFMSYVRHHGFPSPLLDWSQSPYVALFFAFQNAVSESEQRVSIFAYIGDPESEWKNVGPQIYDQSPYVSSHRRHFMQQSQYTIATEKVNEGWVYCSHERCSSDESLIKFTLPRNLRHKYLQKLQQMNINAFTLYGTDESLMDMLAFREIIERDI